MKNFSNALLMTRRLIIVSMLVLTSNSRTSESGRAAANDSIRTWRAGDLEPEVLSRQSGHGLAVWSFNGDVDDL